MPTLDTLLADLPVAWWVFWMTAGGALFVGLVWLLTRLALKVDDDVENEHRDDLREPGSAANAAEQSTPGT